MKTPLLFVLVLFLSFMSCEKKSKGEQLLDDIHDHTEQTVKEVDKATEKVVEDSETEGKKSKSKLDKLFKKKSD